MSAPVVLALTGASGAPYGVRLLEAARSRTPSGVLVTAEAVADVVFFLASPAAQSIQGQIIVADGGYSLLA